MYLTTNYWALNLFLQFSIVLHSYLSSALDLYFCNPLLLRSSSTTSAISLGFLCLHSPLAFHKASSWGANCSYSSWDPVIAVYLFWLWQQYLALGSIPLASIFFLILQALPSLIGSRIILRTFLFHTRRVSSLCLAGSKSCFHKPLLASELLYIFCLLGTWISKSFVLSSYIMLLSSGRIPPKPSI